MKIVLLGYMASGKTINASKLSEILQISHIDLDTFIEEKENLSVPEIFSKKGEIYFRKIETIYLEELLLSDNDFVLSVGGGTPCYANNIDLIKKHAISFYLKATAAVLYTHLSIEKEKRPLVSIFKNDELEEFIAKHLFERNQFYLKADHYIEVNMLKKTVAEVCAEIVDIINLSSINNSFTV